MTHRRLILAALAVLALAAALDAPALAQPADTREARARATEQMLDSAGDEALRQYARDHLAPAYRATFADEAALVAYLRQLRSQVAPIGGVGLMIDDAGDLELHISNRERRSVVAMSLQPEAPRLVVALALAESVARDAGPRVTWDTLESFLAEASEQGFSGSVLAVRDGEVVLDRGFGFADPAGEHPITPATLFAIGSTPIDFTHGAILKLAEMGKVSLDDPITKSFSGVPADKRGITLDHLRTSRSGLIDFQGIEGVDANLDLSWIDRDEFLRRMFAAPLHFAPGTDERHSHGAWSMLAAVIEVASGQDYETFLREHFFEPAGMTRTGHYPLAQRFPAAEVAVGLGGNVWGEVNSPAYWGETSWLVLGSGGMVSTPGDLWRWRRFLASGKVLGEASLRRYGIGGVFLDEGGNDRGFINTIGAHGGDMVIVCSNSHAGMDDATARVALAAARLGAGE